MTFGSLFSGIGGIDLGLERAGMQCKWQVEIDPFATKVLAARWPNVKRYGDIKTVGKADLEPVDLIAGGFPCQDLSQAGKRAGIEGARSGLWFEYARIIGELRPRYVLIENVPGLLVYDGMRRVLGELSRRGYDAVWFSVRAADFGASHLRKRVFIVAYSECAERRPHVEHEQLPARWIETAGGLASDSFALANAGCAGIGRPAESAGLDRRRPSGHDSGTGGTLADPAIARLEIGRDQTGDCRETLGFPTVERTGAFAPGPADPRWPAILRERPDLAPSLPHAIRKHGDDAGHGAGAVRREQPEPPEVCGPGEAPSKSTICRVAHGISDWMDRAMQDRTKRLSRLGNAVVPEIAEWIGRKILESSAVSAPSTTPEQVR